MIMIGTPQVTFDFYPIEPITKISGQTGAIAVPRFGARQGPVKSGDGNIRRGRFVQKHRYVGSKDPPSSKSPNIIIYQDQHVLIIPAFFHGVSQVGLRFFLAATPCLT
jgi:hypothetical protein